MSVDVTAGTSGDPTGPDVAVGTGPGHAGAEPPSTPAGSRPATHVGGLGPLRGLLNALGRGPLPVLLALGVIWAVFQLLNENYLSSRNLSNLVLQMGVVALLAVGVVLVLLIGEIDLSLGATAGVSAAVMGVLLTDRGWPVVAALAAALVTGALIGLLQGSVVVAVGVPSFVVTLGGLLAWQGVQLAVLGSSGERRVSEPLIRGIASEYLPAALAWAILASAVAVTAAVWLAQRRRRSQAGLPVEPVGRLVARLATVAVAGSVLLLYFEGYFGVPWLLVLLLVVTALLTALTRRTPFGRHLYAIGGNAEASRRAGIPVERTRLAVFVLTSTLAGLAGVVAASRQFSVSSATGGGTLLLEAIAAAVIGGTSLFGGRGRIYHALLGALVIVSVSNGLELLGAPSSVENVATGVILVVAVSLDAVTRRRRALAAA